MKKSDYELTAAQKKSIKQIVNEMKKSADKIRELIGDLIGTYTEVNMLVPDNGILSVGQTRRARRSLCGINDCCCGSVDILQGDHDATEHYRTDGLIVYRIGRQQ